MKRKFSLYWQSSKHPRKQRKFNANAPLNVKHKFLSALLSKDLRKKYGKRNFPLKKGDDVLVMRGSFRKKKAKIISIDLKNTKVTLENIQRSKKDGTKVNVRFAPSSLQIQSLNLEDQKRLRSLNKSIKETTKIESNIKNKNVPKKTKDNK